MISSKRYSSYSQTLKYPKTLSNSLLLLIIFPLIGAGGVENGPFCVFQSLSLILASTTK